LARPPLKARAARNIRASPEPIRGWRFDILTALPLMTLRAAKLIFLACRGCVLMIAAPLSRCRIVGLHPVSVFSRHGGREMLVLIIRQPLIFE
jgi:hypothetical protein